MIIGVLSGVCTGFLGCGAGIVSSAPVVRGGPAFAGTVFGGLSPVRGSLVQLYAAGSNGSQPTALLSEPVLTDSHGSFSVPEGYACPAAGSYVYLISQGGGPGAAQPGNNPALSLMVALGVCGELGNHSVIVNEVTTVASVWALAPYMQSGRNVVSSSANEGDLSAAFQTVTEFVDVTTGTSPGPGLAVGATVPVAKVNALANIFSKCVNSGGGVAGDGSACGTLFMDAATAGAAVPANVLDAGLEIARHPAAHVSELYGLSGGSAPFMPSLGSAPTDWTLQMDAPVAVPVISPSGGNFTESQTVSLSDSTPYTTIRYTTDGSLPTAQSPMYAGPFTITRSLTVRAVAFAGSLWGKDASATFTELAPVATHLAFGTQPGDATAGTTLSPAVTVLVEDAQGNPVVTAGDLVTLNLGGNGATSTLGGEVSAAAVNGVATFATLHVDATGTGYRLVAASAGLAPATSNAFAVAAAAASGTTFPVPAADACHSLYDKFYMAEPGVYGFWPLCESGYNSAAADYLGQWQFRGGWSGGTIFGGAPGPVADGETATHVVSADAFTENQNMVVNTNAGTLATWISTDATDYRVTAVWLGAVGKQSGTYIGVVNSGGKICFLGNWQNSAGTPTNIQACGYTPNSWHRVALTWTAGVLTLYVDGQAKATGSYTGVLDNTVFYYKLFPGCCSTGKPMALAKTLVANQAWTAVQVGSDFAPALVAPPAGGVYVTTQQMGTIHRDVLGYADDNQDITQPGPVDALKMALKAGGFTSLRYAGGFGGIDADLADWHGGPVKCSGTNGGTVPAQNIASADTIDNYIPQVAQPLGLHMGYTVNYGTNAPLCNAGGDPVANGANLVEYLNTTKHFGFKYFEIGNEQFSTGSETDMHPNPQTGASYSTYEPAFYDAMKAKDPSIQIAVPISGTTVYDYQTKFDLPVLAGAKYDAIVFHAYPVQHPISDVGTLFPDRMATLGGVRAPLLSVQTELLNAGRDPEAIWVTEWAATVGGDLWSKQTVGAVAPLFVASALAEYMQAGVQYATWWAQGMGNVCSTYNYDYSAESTYGWWSCGSTALAYTGAIANAGEMNVGLKAGDLMPAGRGFQVLSQSGFVTEGEHMLRTQTDDVNAPWLQSYAGTHGGSYAVILINRDRDSAHTVPVRLAGKAAGASVVQTTYGRAQYDQIYFKNWSEGPVQSTHGAWSGTFSAMLPPWSVSVFVFEDQ